MNPIDKVWTELLNSQARERSALALAQADQREALYREHKVHFDSRVPFDPRRDWYAEGNTNV